MARKKSSKSKKKTAKRRGVKHSFKVTVCRDKKGRFTNKSKCGL